ncbi:hypothetical protein KVR01_011784 [Diaporthe batatas]|uniref:uncharacterized protein n=1 Tax=Diaporthe batatas TaxID=748121 RepID=UPI001D054A8D|nr:uncharacterized protein KVR01_011784 [Diaporthe batatas]KAG8158662.1 hypothetical protein KVR01_011784 [Diaporthe batatas]
MAIKEIQPNVAEFKDQYHSQQTPVRIIHVGAGAAGLLTAFKAQKTLRNFSLVCYEKNAGIGGTWYENRYPGCGCDVPAHSYTFSFEPNPDWSGFYVPAPEILAYMEAFADKYGLRQFIQLDTTVLGAEWDDATGEWVVELKRRDGTQFTDRCNVLINGSGPLNKWKMPDIPGLETYKGQICHSSNWDPAFDWKDKRVAVIGSGASGVQVTPQLANGSKSLTLFARSIQWLTPPLGLQDIPVPGVEADKTQTPGPLGKHLYTDAERAALKGDPAGLLEYRKKVDQELQRWFGVFLRDSVVSKAATEAMAEGIRARFGPERRELADSFIPEFGPGCRRNTPAEGFIEALLRDNVTTVRDPIARFTESGLTTNDGHEYEFDMIICCTGFDVAYTPHFPVEGLGGVKMQQAWAEKPRVYLTVATPSFPNFFHVGGPTGNWGSGCVLASHEVQVDYAIQACLKISAERLHSVTPKPGPTDAYMAYNAAWHRAFSHWADECRSWYKNGGRPDGEVMLWCGSMLHMMKTLQAPRWEDYEIRYREANMWAFLGGWGRTELEVKAEAGAAVDLSPFVRQGDEPYLIE